MAEDSLAVAPNNTNTLARPIRRIRLGMNEIDPGGLTQWQIWIPSRGGGKLDITHDAGSNLAFLTLAGDPVKSAAGKLSVTVPRDGHGWYFICSDGNAGTLTCTFTQTAWSRVSADADADPLIPYNFYYYPYDIQGSAHARVLDTIARYTSWSGRQPQYCVDWEKNHHCMPPGTPNSGFEGHCHQAAAASAFFPSPPDVTTIGGFLIFGGEDFDCEQSKILRMEYFGNCGNVHREWSMPGWLGTSAEDSLLSYLKPGGDKGKCKEELLAGLTSVFGPEVAELRVAQLSKQIGGDSEIQGSVTRMFGYAAADFYEALVTHMLFDGQPLLSNLRVFHVIWASARGVWNHALFHYEAVFVETPGSDDPRDMTMLCTISANVDEPPPWKQELPADIVGGIVVPSSDGLVCRRWEHRWRLFFTDKGRASANVLSQWISCQGVGTAEMFAPTNLDTLRPARITDWMQVEAAHLANPDARFRGNPAVGPELIRLDGMSPHARFL